MKNTVTIILCLSFYLTGCQSNNDNKTKLVKQKSNIEQVEDQPEVVSAIDFRTLPKNDFLKQAEKSKIGRMIIFSVGSTLNISSDGKLTYSLLGFDNNPIQLQQEHEGIFSIESQSIKTDMYDDNQAVKKLTYQNSYLKVYYNPVKKMHDIVSGRIDNSKIELAYGLKVGVSKKKFFNIVFENALEFDFSAIDTVCNGNEMGEIEQYFIFSKDTLNKVILKSDYDWIPLE